MAIKEAFVEVGDSYRASLVILTKGASQGVNIVLTSFDFSRNGTARCVGHGFVCFYKKKQGF